MDGLSREVVVDKNGTIQKIFISYAEILAIAKNIRENPAALEALKDGYEAKQIAKKSGQISSPKPPDNYLEIYKIIREKNPRFLGALGPKIISKVEEIILAKDRSDV